MEPEIDGVSGEPILGISEHVAGALLKHGIDAIRVDGPPD
jgi:hypothetical protein